MPSKLFVLSVGGSLINPKEIDIKFLVKLRSLVQAEAKKNTRFIIVCGGGKPARDYQKALGAAGKIFASQLDWMGIYATRLNAQLVRLLFGQLAHPVVAEDPTQKLPFKQQVLIGSGWKPGWSTDYDAVQLAITYGSSTVINLTNIDYAYNKDPRKFSDAEAIQQTTWKRFRKLVGSKWTPGNSAPFDPIASKLAEKNNISVIITNGKNLKNLKNILDGKRFIGTKIY